MSDAQYVFNYPVFIKAIDEDLAAQMEILSMNPEAYSKAQEYLGGDLQSLRFNMLSDQMALSDVWRPIRDNDAVVDLVFDITTSVRFHAEVLHTKGWDQLCDLVGESMGCFNHENVDPRVSTLDDNEELDRFVTSTNAKQFLDSNPWLVTVFILRRTPTVRKLVRELAERINRMRRTAGTAEAGET